MLIPMKRIAVPLVVVPFLAMPGCGPRKVVGIASGGPSWTIVAEDPIPGIHDGTASVITLRFGPPTGVTVVVWSDVSRSSTNGGTRDDHAFDEGTLLTTDGRRVEYRCETDNGTVAKVIIDGTAYDSTKGSLFLISTQSEKTQVKQLVADVRNIPREAEAIRDYALGNPEIAAFFKDAKNRRPVEQEQ
ncbi:MAG: hypothetical protein H8E44_38090 [Planctomycetes bacterium]|nr:hypothetical protein [Planctomycetota bacterium]